MTGNDRSMGGVWVFVRTLMALLVCVPLAAQAEDRVKTAREERTKDVEALLAKVGLTSPVDELYLRAFKHERELELWAGKKGQALKLVKTYPFCAASGELGPKRREGDLQVPEGLYEISSFNPQSNFHLSLKVSYPNASDRVRSDAKRPGGLIYLHGNCASIGCIAIEDEPIEEVYLIALDAKVRKIPFHIFPARLTDEKLAELSKESAHAGFWKELAPAFTQFEATRRPARFRVDARTGAYRVQPASGQGSAASR